MTSASQPAAPATDKPLRSGKIGAKSRRKDHHPTVTDKTEKKLRNLKPFKPGAEWAGNAEGRPKGARNRLCAQYIEDLQTVWRAEGITAIRKAAKDRPVAFMNAVGNLVPREFDVGDKTAATDWVAAWRMMGEYGAQRAASNSEAQAEPAPPKGGGNQSD